AVVLIPPIGSIPSCPSLLLPQHKAVPVASKPHECWKEACTWRSLSISRPNDFVTVAEVLSVTVMSMVAIPTVSGVPATSPSLSGVRPPGSADAGQGEGATPPDASGLAE